MPAASVYTAKELSPSTWPDFEALFAKHNGVWGGCWCMFYHKPGTFLIKGQADKNKQAKKSLVKKRQSHGIIVYSNGTPVGWTQYGLRPELSRLDASPTYNSLRMKDDGKRLWRVTCFFVHRGFRRKGVARFGLNAVLASVKKKGGGIIEAYPSVKPVQGASMMWSGTARMFEDAGFKTVSKFGKSHVVVRRTIR